MFDAGGEDETWRGDGEEEPGEEELDEELVLDSEADDGCESTSRADESLPARADA